MKRVYLLSIVASTITVILLLQTSNLTAQVPTRHIPDTMHVKFRIGTNFDFMNDNLKLNKVYGALCFANDSVVHIGTKNNRSLNFGMDMGSSRSSTLSVLKEGFISEASFIDPIHPVVSPDLLNINVQTIRSKQSQGFGQLSLFFNPFLSYNLKRDDDTSSAFRIAIGGYAELYRVTSYLKYSDTSIIAQRFDTISSHSRFVPTNFNDSVGSTNSYGYFGVSLSLTYYARYAIVKIKGVFGKTLVGQNENEVYHPTRNVLPSKNKSFYLIDASITEPHSKISIEATIRGFLPNYTPVWSVFATKSVDLGKLFDAIVH